MLTVDHPSRSSPDLDWFVEWRPWLWKPAVERVLADPGRFQAKRVLELGFRTGRMSCCFGLMGATVLGLDVGKCDVRRAEALARELNVADRVSFRRYDGDLTALPAGHWDFVFTKSVLVLLPLPETAIALRRLLAPGGQYLACENLRLPFGLNRLRTYEAGLDDRAFACLRQHFSRVDVHKRFGIVASIVATA